MIGFHDPNIVEEIYAENHSFVTASLLLNIIAVNSHLVPFWFRSDVFFCAEMNKTFKSIILCSSILNFRPKVGRHVKL